MAERSNVNHRRIESLRAEMVRTGFDLTVIAPTDNALYLLGFSPPSDERACMLLIGRAGTVLLVGDLNANQVSAAAPDLELVGWKDEVGPHSALLTALAKVNETEARHVAIDPGQRADHLLLLQQALPAAKTKSAESLMGALREVKDAEEIMTLRRSALIADKAVQAAFAQMRPGVTELGLVDVVSRAFTQAGAVVAFAFIAGGPHGAFPHHDSGTRTLREGDAVVVDVGGRAANYLSDITRMAFIGEPSAAYLEVHAVVAAATRAGIAAAIPGATCADVDNAARTVIEDAGYGKYFVHRTGHGLGVSAHESPWIMQGNDTVLVPGNVFSIEPGIYLPGEFGVRIEDTVYMTEAGAAAFSTLSHDLHLVA